MNIVSGVWLEMAPNWLKKLVTLRRRVKVRPTYEGGKAATLDLNHGIELEVSSSPPRAEQPAGAVVVKVKTPMNEAAFWMLLAITTGVAIWKFMRKKNH